MHNYPRTKSFLISLVPVVLLGYLKFIGLPYLNTGSLVNPESPFFISFFIVATIFAGFNMILAVREMQRVTCDFFKGIMNDMTVIYNQKNFVYIFSLLALVLLWSLQATVVSFNYSYLIMFLLLFITAFDLFKCNDKRPSSLIYLVWVANGLVKLITL